MHINLTTAECTTGKYGPWSLCNVLDRADSNLAYLLL